MKSKYMFPGGYGYALFFIPLSLLVWMFGNGCKKFIVVVPPTNQVTAATVYNSDATATAVLTGIYTNLSGGGFMTEGLSGTAFFTGLSSDELTIFNNINVNTPTDYAYYQNQIGSGIATGSGFWSNIWQTVYTANAAIEGLTGSNGLTPAIKQQLLGEAKFMRAFCYFYLVNLYGGVPLITSTSYSVNSDLARAPVDTIYRQIVSDLKDAQNLLSSNYLDATLINTTTERVRPTQSAATALLARVYLYMGNWADAEIQATVVINNSAMYNLVPLNNVFLRNNSEAIWQLQGIVSGANTNEAQSLILPSVGPNEYNFVYLNPDLANSFDSGDQRKNLWLDSLVVPDTVSYYGVNYYGGGVYYYGYKYQNITYTPGSNNQTEYITVLRLGEQYLIRAEARARQGNIAGAQADINMIRNRAGLPNTSAGDLSSLLKDLAHQRQDELFLEWGDRWLDLKRTGELDSVMSVACPRKGGTWHSEAQWYALPQTDIKADPHLTQNPGY